MDHPLELARAANPLEIAITVWIFDRPKQAVVNTNSRITTMSIETEVTCRRNNAEELFSAYKVVSHDICSPGSSAQVMSKCTLRVDLYLRQCAFSAPVFFPPHQEVELILGLDIIAHLGFRLFIGSDSPQQRAPRNQRKRARRRQYRRIG